MGIGRLPKGVTLQICIGQGPAVPLVVVVGWGCPPFLLGQIKSVKTFCTSLCEVFAVLPNSLQGPGGRGVRRAAAVGFGPEMRVAVIAGHIRSRRPTDASMENGQKGKSQEKSWMLPSLSIAPLARPRPRSRDVKEVRQGTGCGGGTPCFQVSGHIFALGDGFLAHCVTDRVMSLSWWGQPLQELESLTWPIFPMSDACRGASCRVSDMALSLYRWQRNCMAISGLIFMSGVGEQSHLESSCQKTCCGGVFQEALTHKRASQGTCNLLVGK